MSATRPPFIEALLDAQCYPHEVDGIELVETHISWVLLTGELAYKIKKPVELPFVDFSSLERRKRYCDEELALNRRLAPELYLDVVPIGGSPGAPRVGTEPAFEYAVKMRQFPGDARLDRALARRAVPDGALETFAETLARFHADSPALPGTRNAAAARTVDAALDNLHDLAAQPLPEAAAKAFAAARDWTEARAADLAGTLAARFATDAFKDCHGDLHLENLVLLGERIVAFDALEFDTALREIDVVNEAAFVAMDLMAHARTGFAYRFLTRYLEAGGGYDGLPVLRWYLVYRALVRAKVAGVKAAQLAADDTARQREESAVARYLELAAALTAPRRPLLAITHGLSGSGKTHITNALIGRLPALRVRSDLERKRLLGVATNARTGSGVGSGAYGAEMGQKTYARLREIAAASLANGFDIVVDAAFLRGGEREAFRTLAEEHGARFAILDCRAGEAELRRRIRARGDSDASEATGAVLDAQLRQREPLAGDAELAAVVPVDTERAQDYDAVAARLGLKDGGRHPT